jgi:putative ABC transport system permease protein
MRRGGGPPRLLAFLLRAALPEREREDVLDGMAELHEARERRAGRAAAGLWYLRHAVRFALAVRLRARAQRHHGTGGGGMKGLGGELLRGARRLRRAPVFTVVSVLTLGVGIGAFASTYSVVDTVLLEPPPYREPENLVWVWRDYWFDLERGWLGGPDIAGLRAHDDVFEGVVAFRSLERNLTGREVGHQSCDASPPKRLKPNFS